MAPAVSILSATQGPVFQMAYIEDLCDGRRSTTLLACEHVNSLRCDNLTKRDSKETCHEQVILFGVADG